MDLIEISAQFRVVISCESRPTLSGLEREAHDNIGASKLITTEIFSAVRRRSHLALEEFEMGLVTLVEEHGFDSSSYHTGDGFDEEWHRGPLDT